MRSYIKTTISRDKLYKRNYERDSIEINEDIKEEKMDIGKYKALIDVLTLMYIESNDIGGSNYG